jgi:hypothetical protein
MTKGANTGASNQKTKESTTPTPSHAASRVIKKGRGACMGSCDLSGLAMMGQSQALK